MSDLVFKVTPGGKLSGDIRVPGDKSISHRSIILGSIADGLTTVEGFLEGEDSLATLEAFRAMGVQIDDVVADKTTIQGVGLHGLTPPAGPLYLGNSGTSMRLLSGLLAAQAFPTVLTGDKSLSSRPMRRVTDPLTEMGANIVLQEGGVAPIHISAGKLHPIIYDLPVASAQIKSCLLLASLYTDPADGSSQITEPAPCRDHTERMLRGFGYEIGTQGARISITGGGSLSGCHIDVPADISSAAFFLVGASIAEGSDLLLRHVGINPTRTGVINILLAMGADISIENPREVGGEPVADIRVKYAPLKGIEIPLDQVPLAIDEFPALFIAAACAQGTTTLSGAEELRVKESDRIQVMADGLATLGVTHVVKDDGIIIEGGPLSGGEINSHGDHRIAMAFTMAGLKATKEISIHDCHNVATSFPGFTDLAGKTGISLEYAEK
jgi:3-phosphoshikimate 1-carboxyvinyltransferase